MKTFKITTLGEFIDCLVKQAEENLNVPVKIICDSDDNPSERLKGKKTMLVVMLDLKN